MLSAIEVDGERITMGRIRHLEVDFEGVNVEFYIDSRTTTTKQRTLDEVRFIDSGEKGK